jgi:hypothetical protein
MRIGLSTRCAVLSFALALAGLSGCAGRIEGPKPPPEIAPQTASYTADDYAKDLKAYAAATGADQVSLRNKMVYSIAAEIDYAFYNYETQLFLEEGNFHVGADFIQLGLAAASTVSPAARTKTILSALLSGVTGVNLSVDKNYFKQQTVQAITSSMEANRDRVKTGILQQLKLDITAYPFSAARADLIHYFFAGTLNAGLQQLTQTAAASAQDQKATLNSVKAANFSAADVNCVTGVNQAVKKAFAANDLGTLTNFLQALGSTIKANPTQADVLTELRALGSKVSTDADFRVKYCAEAQKERLIQ